MKISILIVITLCVLITGYIVGTNHKKDFYSMAHNSSNSNSVTFPGYHDLRLGGEESLKNWIAAGGNVNMFNDEGESLLHVAAGPNYAKTYNPDLLVEAEVSPSLEIVQLLLDAEANVNTRDKNGATPLYRAVLWGDTKILNLLLTYGADINTKDLEGDTPLHVAAIHGASETKWLLEHGADVNAKNNAGNTALSLAQRYNHAETINLLKSYEAKE